MQDNVRVRSRNELFTIMGALLACLVVWAIVNAINYRDIMFIIWAIFYFCVGLFTFTIAYHDMEMTAYKDAIEVKYGLLLMKQRRIEGSRIKMIVPTGKPARYFLRKFRLNDHHPRLASIHVYAGAFSDKCLLIVLEDRALIVSCPNPDDLAGQLRKLYGLEGTNQEVPDWAQEIIGEF